MRPFVGGLAMLLLPLLSAGSATTAATQGTSLDRRVAAVTDGLVELHFDARADACGDGVRWYRVGSDTWYGSYTEMGNGAARAECAAGPARVLVAIAGREIVRLETFVGPLQHEATATDVGAVPGREVAAWLLSLAARLDGRPARDAIAPAMLASDGAPLTGLLVIARDKDRARETRRSAISWIPRAADAREEQAARSLTQLARDESDAPVVRQQAVSTLLRLPLDAGIAWLIELAGSGEDVWLARESTRALARSGDPRARAFLRTAVADARRSDDLRASAVSGLGGEQATGADAKLLRDVYRTLDAERTREAVLVAISSVGGSTNARWLMSVATDERETPALRRRAVALAEHAGATGVELSVLFDAVNDTETRGSVINALAQEGSKPARDKLVNIAKSTEIPTIRRRAIAALERFDSPDVRGLLTTLARPQP